MTYPSTQTGRFATEVPSSTETVLADVGEERERQFIKWGPQHHLDGTSDDEYSRHMRDRAIQTCDRLAEEGTQNWWAILREEAFEARAEEEPGRLRKELVQAAAVLIAWIEDIDSRKEAWAYVDPFEQEHDIGGEG